MSAKSRRHYHCYRMYHIDPDSARTEKLRAAPVSCDLMAHGNASQARVAGKTGTPVLAEYSLDRLGAKPVLRLPTAKRGSADHMTNTNVPSDLQEKVASLLASESSRKVHPGLSPSSVPAVVDNFSRQEL